MSQPLGLFLPYLLPFVSPRTPSAPLPQRPPSPGAPGHPRTPRDRGAIPPREPWRGGGRRGGDNFQLRLCSIHTHPHTHSISHSFFSFCRNPGGGSPRRESWREPLHAPGGSFCPLSILPLPRWAAQSPAPPALPGSARSGRRSGGNLVPAKLRSDPVWARSLPHRLLLAL